MSAPVSISLFQQGYLASQDATLAQTSEWLKSNRAKQQDQHILVLHELHGRRYLCQNHDMARFDEAITLDGAYVQALRDMAQAHRSVIVSTIMEKATPHHFYNTAICIDSDGRMAGKYRKSHIPDDPGYHEKYYFSPGDTGFEPIQTKAGKLGVMVCWDQWFPESARLLALKGADIIIVPTSIGWDKLADDTTKHQELDAWLTVQRGHAIANVLPIAVCNRLGFEAHPTQDSCGTDFWGHSFITDHFGQYIANAEAGCHAISANIDYEKRNQLLRTWPFFRDRRPDLYQGLLKKSAD